MKAGIDLAEHGGQPEQGIDSAIGESVQQQNAGDREVHGEP